jgi:cytochrome c
MKHVIHALSLAILAAGTAPAMAETAFDQIKVVAGEKLYDAECRRCLAPDSEHASYGLPLNNVVGRGAGTVEGYDYSIALEASGIVWTPAALRAWMADNDGFMPGTKCAM